jgi:GNAT superfamily N-acetyltransferase
VIRPLEDVDDIAGLATLADAEGYPFVTGFITDWKDGSNRFDRPGECAFVGLVDGEVVGVCGLNIDPYTHDSTIGRVRHLYVATSHRRTGIASKLVGQIVGRAHGSFTLLRLRTRNPEAAAFYEARGFERVDGDEYCTHAMRLETP